MIKPKDIFGLRYARFRNYLNCLFLFFLLAIFTVYLDKNIHAFSAESLTYANVFLYTFIFIFSIRKNGLLSYYSIFLIFLFIFVFSRYFVSLLGYSIDSFCAFNMTPDIYRITSIINFSFLLSSFIPSLFFKNEYKFKLSSLLELEKITKKLIFFILPFHFIFLSVYAFQILTNDISLVYLDSKDLIFKMSGLSPLNITFKLLTLFLMGYFCSLPKKLDKKIIVFSLITFFIFFIIGFKKIFIGYLFFLLWYFFILKKLPKRYIVFLSILIPLAILSNSLRYINLFGYNNLTFDMVDFLFHNSQTYCVYNYYFLLDISNQPISPFLSPLTDRLSSLLNMFGYNFEIKNNMSNFIARILNPDFPANGTGTAFFIEVYDFFGLVFGSLFIFFVFFIFHIFEKNLFCKRFYLFFSFLFIPFIVLLPRGYFFSILINLIFMFILYYFLYKIYLLMKKT